MDDLNLEHIYEQARMNWIRRHAPKRNIEDSLMAWRYRLSWVSFLAMALLSASHTVTAFMYNVPGIAAYIAPAAIELFLIATTLKARVEQQERRLVGATKWLLILVAVTANGISGVSVAFALAKAWEQIAYVAFALIAAPIVPLATVALGENLTSLMRARADHDRVAAAWKLVEYDIFRRALYAQLMRAGSAPREAARDAERIASGYVSGGRTVTPTLTPADGVTPVTPRLTAPADIASAVETETRPMPSVSAPLSKRQQAVNYLTANPDKLTTPLRDLEQLTSINRQTLSEAKAEVVARVKR